MLYSTNSREELEDLEELALSKNQVKEVRIQDKLGERNYRNVKKLYEPLTDTIKDTSQDITKTITETSIKNIKAIETLNNKLLEIMNDRGKLASYL